MQSADDLAAELRVLNHDAFIRAGVGHAPPARFLDQARALGDELLVAECLLCVAIAQSRSGRPKLSRATLSDIRDLLAGGVEFDLGIRWRYEYITAIVTDDFGELQDSARWHRKALGTARASGVLAIQRMSLTSLGYVSIQLGDISRALEYLHEAIVMPVARIDLRIALHLMISRSLAHQKRFRSAAEHLDIAMMTVVGSEDLVDKRMLRTLCMLTMDLDDDAWAGKHRARMRDFVDTSGTRLNQLESVLYEAKLDQVDGLVEQALIGVRSVVDTCERDLSLWSTAMIQLAELLVATGNYVEGLEVLDDPELNLFSSDLGLRALKLRRNSLQYLGRWEEAAHCFDAIERRLRDRSRNVTQMYELQQTAQLSAQIESQNSVLRSKNSELEVLGVDQELILETIANKLQSPLTALRLALGPAQSDEDVDERCLSVALRSIRRIDALASQLSLAGELEAGGIIPETETFDLAALLGEVCEPLAPDMLVSTSFGATAESANMQRWLLTADRERTAQLFSSLLWGISEYSPVGSVGAIVVEELDEGETLVTVEALAFAMSPEALSRMRHKQSLVGTSAAPHVAAELSFYVVDQLCEALDVRMSYRSKKFSFTLRSD